MAFDLAWGFRANANYVTDPSYQVPCLGELYPHTYTAANGYSVNAGWVTTAPTAYDGNASNDPRIAGCHYDSSANGVMPFRVNLASGSAPGAGTYTLDGASGIQNNPQYVATQVKDDTTSLLTNDGLTGGANHFFDLTGTDITGGASWGGTPVTGQVFASTTCYFVLNYSYIGAYHAVSHFRLTKQETGPMPVDEVDSFALALAEDQAMLSTEPTLRRLSVRGA